MTNNPLNALRHHVTGAIERGEKTAIVEQRSVGHADGLIKGIEDLFNMMDEGILVRDISRDGDADFYKRNLDFVMRLAKIKQAIDAAKLVAMPVCGACGRNYRPDEFSKGEYCQTCQPGNIRAS